MPGHGEAKRLPRSVRSSGQQQQPARGRAPATHVEDVGEGDLAALLRHPGGGGQAGGAAHDVGAVVVQVNPGSVDACRAAAAGVDDGGAAPHLAAAGVCRPSAEAQRGAALEGRAAAGAGLVGHGVIGLRQGAAAVLCPAVAANNDAVAQPQAGACSPMADGVVLVGRRLAWGQARPKAEEVGGTCPAALRHAMPRGRCSKLSGDPTCAERCQGGCQEDGGAAGHGCCAVCWNWGAVVVEDAVLVCAVD